MCRVDSDGELSWTVAPEHRGKGYGSEVVKRVVELSEEPRFAEIKSSNLASLAIVKRLGFEQVSDGEMTRWRWIPEQLKSGSQVSAQNRGANLGYQAKVE
jgi:RimJ/RimL family protein N-acetyltransferase